MPILFAICMIAFGAFMVAAMLLWAFSIQRYVEAHGKHSASVLFNSAIWRDYQTAVRVAKSQGTKPKFLTWFEVLSIAAIVFPDGAVTVISIVCAVLAYIAIGYIVFIVVRAFYFGLTKAKSREKHGHDA